MSMSSIYPTSDRFLDLEAAIVACRNAAAENGYGLRLGSRKVNRQGVVTSRQLRCDRAGTNESESKGIRHSGSQRCNCPFAFWIRLSGNEYFIDISHLTHNHAPSISAYGHASVTRITEEEKGTIIRKSELGIRPRTILAELRQEDSHATAIGIYNCLSKHRKQQLGGQTPICALLRLLRGEGDHEFREQDREQDREWWFDFSVDANDSLTRLFFVHITSMRLLQKFPEVIIMDCTYSANRFGMPLLHIVGCTNINTTFEVGYAFLSRETEEDYVWALDVLRNLLSQNNIPEPGVIVTDRKIALLNAIDKKFPTSNNILCAWHIKMAIKSHHSKELDADNLTEFMDDFLKVWNASTRIEFSEFWSSCSTKWTSKNPNGRRIIKYLEDTWLPYVDRFANCFVSRYLHLGHLTSGKAEGAHHYLKMFIAESTENLFTVVKRIRIALGQQYQRYLHLLHKEQDKGIMQGTLFRAVNTLVCRHSLKLVETQLAYLEKHQARYQKFGIPIPDCKCNFTFSIGIPCYHTLKDKLESCQRLCLTGFYRQWHLVPSPNIIDPRLNDSRDIETLEQPENLAESQNSNGNTSCLCQRRKRGIETVEEPVAKRSRRMRLAANLAPSDTIVNEIINSTQRQPSCHEDAITINVEDVNLANSTSLTTSNSSGSVSIRAPRLCSDCHQPGHTYRTCSMRRVTIMNN